MGIDIKRVCDRCGKEILEGAEFTTLKGRVYQYDIKAIMPKRFLQFTEKGSKFDLCETCTEKLKDFLFGKEKAE